MLTHPELQHVVEALRPKLLGAQVQKIRQPDPLTLILRARRPGQSTHVVLSATPKAPRVAEAEAGGETLLTPTAINTWLRATLSGRRVEGWALDPQDRIVTLTFEAGRLVCEIGGRSPNLYGLDPRGILRASAAPLRAGLSLGAPYTPPPPMPPGPPPRPPQLVDPLEVERAAHRLLDEAATTTAAAVRARLLRQTRQRLERLIDKLSREVEHSARAAQDLRWGELLKGQAHQIRRGASVARVQDWYAPGAPFIEIPLDPKLSGPENLDKLFARYKKAKAGEVQRKARLEAAEEALLKLEIYAEEIADTPTLAARLYAEGIASKPRSNSGGGRHTEAPRLPYQLFYGPSLTPIWVGRGGQDNHTLTFQLARGHDLWLHVRDAAGSHVIIPTGRAEVDRETLLDAAALAAHHSKLKGEPLVEVSYTQRKHVRAIKGAAPGRVSLAAASTVLVGDIPARIALIYQRRREAEVPSGANLSPT
ncbi:DUF814 domain-containing protein [Myxococcota bacterium]|nr:DUF814 domain-containing protein [Myxococcota bacterium]MBU1898623.1 DUF814 domain-containing protein [Myxococcota bacterium]